MRDERPVLVLSELDDFTADCVIMALQARDVPVVRLDPGVDFPGAASFAARLDDGGFWTGQLMTETRRLDLSSVRAVYRRRPSPHTPSPEMDAQAARFVAKEARHGFSGILANLPNCLYVNHPNANRRADVKVTQLKVAASVSLRVPPSLVTNNLKQARAFAAKHGSVVYKPLTFVRYVAPDGPAPSGLSPSTPTSWTSRSPEPRTYFKRVWTRSQISGSRLSEKRRSALGSIPIHHNWTGDTTTTGLVIPGASPRQN